MTAFTFQLKQTTAVRLAGLAKRRALSSVEMAELAIEEFIEREEWQISEIEAAVAEADADDFATDEEVSVVMGKFMESPLYK